MICVFDCMFEVVCASGRWEFHEIQSRKRYLHRGLGGTIAYLMLQYVAKILECCLKSVCLRPCLLNSYAKGLAIPTKDLALSLPSHMRNDIKHLQRNQGLGNHQIHKHSNIHIMGICSKASASAVAPASPISLEPSQISFKVVLWRRASGVIVCTRMPCPQHHTGHPLTQRISMVNFNLMWTISQPRAYCI